MDEVYDVVVIGGGAAGLSGAVALARSRRSVLVLDAGEPRNALAGHVHNFLTRDNVPPEQVYTTGRGEVVKYGGRIEQVRVEDLRRVGVGFEVKIGDRRVTARRVLLATGARDELPEIEGLARWWGTGVLHCAYCHGWEVRDRRLGILATGPMAVHQALLFRQLSPHVTFLAHAGPAPHAQQLDQFGALGVPVVTGTVERVEFDASGVTGVRLADGSHVRLDALIVAPRCVARAELVVPLGLRATEVRLDGHLVGTKVEADATGATRVPGLWVAGNIVDIQAHVISAAAAGLAAAVAINSDLVATDAAHAMRAHQAKASIPHPTKAANQPAEVTT